MSEEELIDYAAPTLAGLKTGSLFTSRHTSDEEIRQDVRRLNRMLSLKGLVLVPMSKKNGRVLLYLYRKSRLDRDLLDAEAVKILRERGYRRITPGACVAELICRLRREGAFPHEIGLFLGYPPDDVRGFMDHRDVGCKCVGTWKVYGDAAAAQKVFARYRRCTEIYGRCYSRGRSVEQMIVAG